MRYIKLFEAFKKLQYRLKKELPLAKFHSGVGVETRPINYYCFCKTLDEQYGVLDILESLGYDDGITVKLMDEDSVHCAITWNPSTKHCHIQLSGSLENNPLFEEIKFDDYFEKDPKHRGHFGMKKFGLT